MKWENQYIVFDVTKGPKVIIETLDTYGDEGWECCSMLNIAGTSTVINPILRTPLRALVTTPTAWEVASLG